MDPLGTNPFAVMTFIVAPAILTNASTVLGLQTSNRFARVNDRARELSRLIEGRPNDQDPEAALRLRQLDSAESRAMLLVRAMTAFYLSVGSFATASLASLLGALFVLSGHEALRLLSLGVALVSGVIGVGGLTAGSGLLVWETRQALKILLQLTEFARDHRTRRIVASGERPTSP